MTFEVIASSSAGNAYILRDEGLRPLLVDAGVNAAHIMRRVMVSGAAGVLVSHSHGDHCRAIPKLLTLGVNVWASAPTLAALGLADDYRGHVIGGDPVDINGWRAVAFDLLHDAEGTVGFVVAGKTGKLAYITDTAYCPVKFQGITHWAVECNYSRAIVHANIATGRLHSARHSRVLTNHMSIETAVKLFQANDMSTAREIHLLHLSDINSDAEGFAREVRAATGVPTYVAGKRPHDNRRP